MKKPIKCPQKKPYHSSSKVNDLSLYLEIKGNLNYFTLSFSIPSLYEPTCNVKTNNYSLKKVYGILAHPQQFLIDFPVSKENIRLDSSNHDVFGDLTTVEAGAFAALTLAECVQVRSHGEQVESCCFLLQCAGIYYERQEHFAYRKHS